MLMYKRKKLKIQFYIILIIFITTIIILNIRIANVVSTAAQSSAKNLATYTINSITNEYLKSANDLYQNILIEGRNSDGNIGSVNVDISKINMLQGEISSRILEELRENSNSYIKMPITSVFGLSVFSNWGPTLPLKVIPLSNINVKFEDSFTSAGINQTRLTVNLHVQIDMMVFVSPYKSPVKTEQTIPVAQMILIGDVPNTYTHLEGVKPGISVNNN